MITKREQYILEQLKDSPKTEIQIELDEDIYESVKEAAEIMGITISEFIEIALAEKLIEIEKEKFKGRYYSKIIDIYDFYRIDEILDEIQENRLPYLAINPNGNHVVLMRPEEWEDLTTTFDDAFKNVDDNG